MIRLLIILSFLCTSGCATVFSHYQSAELAGVGNVEVTPSFSIVTLFAEGDSDHVQNTTGGEIAVGLHRIVDFRLGYARLDITDGDGINVVGGGPKISLDSDKVALYIPVGFAFGDGIEINNTLEIHPTILFTNKVNDKFEITPSFRTIIPLSEIERDVLIAFTIGAGFGDEDSPVIVRPELGVLANPGSSGIYWSAGVGLTFKLSD